jgi:hypothetical protein
MVVYLVGMVINATNYAVVPVLTNLAFNRRAIVNTGVFQVGLVTLANHTVLILAKSNIVTDQHQSV